MKQLLLLFISLLLTGLAACKKDEGPSTVIRIKVLVPPVKVEYFEGDQILDLTGMEVKLTFDGGKEKTVAFADFEKHGVKCEPSHGQQLALGRTSVHISYGDSDPINYFVVNVSKVEVTEIQVVKAPSKSEYYYGEEIDLEGLEVMLVKNNGDAETFALNTFETNGLKCPHSSGTVLTPYVELTVTHTPTNLTAKIPISNKKLTDIDGNSYSLCKIGDQIWMGENLSTTKLNDGTDIALINAVWRTLTTPAYNWYENREELSSKNKYGAYYNFLTVETEKLCPEGWHVPSTEDWNSLIGYLSQNGYDGQEADAIKKKGAWNNVSGWPHLSDDITLDSFGFSAVPSGWLIATLDAFGQVDAESMYWLNNIVSSNAMQAHTGALMLNDKTVQIKSRLRTYGLPVRCVKD
ncbi:MAG: fibrobacter succinogenes major paralogous domain-containing protein [Breznakibacter sp.]